MINMTDFPLFIACWKMKNENLRYRLVRAQNAQVSEAILEKGGSMLVTGTGEKQISRGILLEYQHLTKNFSNY